MPEVCFIFPKNHLPMRLSIVQSPLEWEDKNSNLHQFDKKLAPLAGQTDLVVLPEMFSTGFSMNPEKLAEDMNGPTMRWLAEKAEQLGAVIAGSFICREDGQHFNRLVWMRPDTCFATYDKRHAFSLAGEDKHYQKGAKQLIVNWKDFSIRPLICYDLRFPVWSRNRKTEPYDLLIYVANWPAPRAHHWRSLLQARAIENQAYCVGVNIVGQDGNGFQYQGDSTIFDFAGNAICHLSQQAGVFTTELSLAKLTAYRQSFPFLQDADDFEL